MHFLKPGETFSRSLPKQRACVVVTLVNKTKLKVNLGIKVAKAGSLWCLLPSRIVVVDSDDAMIEPEPGQAFYVTAESFNPSHLLLMIDPRDMSNLW